MVEMQLLLGALVLLGAVWIVRIYIVNYSKLQENIGALSASVDSAIDRLAAYSTPAELAEDFEQASASLAAVPSIGPIWREFSRTLVRSDDDTAILSPRPASDFFHMGVIERSGIDFRSFESVPNTLIGFGLLFTFLGLLFTVAIAAFALGGGPDEIQQGLTVLMVSAGIKFITSVVAIFYSLRFTDLKNRLFHALDMRFEVLCAQIDALTSPISPEELAADSRSELEHQSELLGRNNSDLAREVATMLDATLRTNLPVAMEPLIGEVKRIALDIHHVNESTMKYMIDRFVEGLGGSVREHTDTMTAMLDQVATVVRVMPDQIKAAGDRFETAFDTVTQRIDATLQGSAASLDTLLRQAGENVSVSGKVLEEISGQLHTMLAEVQAASVTLTERSEKIDAEANSALGELTRGAEQVARATEALAPLAELGTRLEALTAELTSATAEMKNFAETSRASVEQGRAAAAQLDAAAKGFGGSVAGLEQSLDSVFRQLAEGVNGHHERVGKAVGEVDYNLGLAVDRLSAVLAQSNFADHAVRPRAVEAE